jgi:hypothetical protein
MGIYCLTHDPCICLQVPQETEQPHPGCQEQEQNRNQLLNACSLYLVPDTSSDRATSSWMPRAGAKIGISCLTHVPCVFFQVPQETEQPHPGCQEQEQR